MNLEETTLMFYHMSIFLFIDVFYKSMSTQERNKNFFPFFFGGGGNIEIGR